MNHEDLLAKITDFIKSEARTETVVGESFQLGGYECVPIIKLAMGFGTGGGEGDSPKSGKGSGGGAGAGVTINPIGFLVSKDDNISFLGIKESKGLSAMFEKVPEVMEGIFNKNKKEGKN